MADINGRYKNLTFERVFGPTPKSMRFEWGKFEKQPNSRILLEEGEEDNIHSKMRSKNFKRYVAIHDSIKTLEDENPALADAYLEALGIYEPTHKMSDYEKRKAIVTTQHYLRAKRERTERIHRNLGPGRPDTEMSEEDQ